MSKKYLETIRAVNGEIFNLEYHQWRLESVLDSLKVKNRHKLQSLLNPPKNGIYRCRVVYTKDDIKVEYFEYVKRHIKSIKLIQDDEIEYSKKYENRECIDRLFLQKNGCDDILVVKNGLVTDTSTANIAFYDGIKWITPQYPLLLGTTRDRLLKNKKIVEQNIKPSDIKNFQKIALMNAMVDFDIITEDNIREVIC